MGGVAALAWPLVMGAGLAALALAGMLGGPEATLVWAALTAAPLGALSVAWAGARSGAGGRAQAGAEDRAGAETRSGAEVRAGAEVTVGGASRPVGTSLRACVATLAPLLIALAFVPGKFLGAHSGGAFGRAAPSLPWAGAVLVGFACGGAGLALLMAGRAGSRNGGQGSVQRAGRAGPMKGASPRACRVALALLLLGAGLHGLPTRGGLGRSPWPPEVAARALDASPVTLVAEAAGIDWARRPAIYGPAGADSLGPTLRTPWRPALAGTGALMLGCALGCAAVFATRRRNQDPLWRRASSSAPSPRS